MHICSVLWHVQIHTCHCPILSIVENPLTVFPAKLLTEILQRHYKERAFTRCAIMIITDAKALGSSEVDRNSALKHSPHPSSRKNIGPNTPETRAVVLAMLSRKVA